MANIELTLVDYTGSKKVAVELPEDRPVAELLPTLTKRLGYSPSSGWPKTRWIVEHKASGVRLKDEETLGAQVKAGDELLILPEIAEANLPEQTTLRGNKFSDMAFLVTLILNERLLALAIPKEGSVHDLTEFLRIRLSQLNPPLALPSTCSLYLKRTDEFLAPDESVAEVLGNQDVIEVREVLKLEGIESDPTISITVS